MFNIFRILAVVLSFFAAYCVNELIKTTVDQLSESIGECAKPRSGRGNSFVVMREP